MVPRHGASAPAAIGIPVIPAAAEAQVWLDFDGTVTTGDLLDELIAKFSRNDSWKLVEERWRSGLIGSRECLEQEFALLDLSRRQLEAELARVSLDPGAAGLLTLLEHRSVPVAILSDGIERFIRAILDRAGVAAPTIRANAVEHRGRRLSLRPLHGGVDCPSRSAHCKCESTRALGVPGRKSIYVGDGRSDLCAARKADVVFAKGALAAALDKEHRPFTLFSTLDDVRAALLCAWEHGAKGREAVS